MLRSGVASAQEASEPDRAADLFAQGKAAAAKRDWPNAYRLYRESWTIRPSYDTAANVGHSALKLERAAEAGPYLAYALGHFPATGNANKRAELSRLLDAVKAKTTTVIVAVEPKNSDVRVDGQPADVSSETLFLEPGNHTIELSAAGYESQQQTVVATAGAQQDLQIVLKQIAVSAPPTAPATDPAAPGSVAAPPPASPNPGADSQAPAVAESDSNVLPAVLIGGGVALVALGTGIGFTLAANSSQDEAERLDRTFSNDSTCSANPNDARCKELSEHWESHDRQRNISYVAFGVAGAAVIATTVYVLLPSSESGSKQTRARARPMIAGGPKHMALGIEGSF